MTYRRNLIGDLMQEDRVKAANKLRILLRNSNGNGKLVAEALGVNERQVRRWIQWLFEEGVADLRAYRKKVRAQVKGAITTNARGRQTPTNPA